LKEYALLYGYIYIWSIYLDGLNILYYPGTPNVNKKNTLYYMKLRSDLVLRTIGSDHLIVDPSQDRIDLSTVYTLNSSAAWLWEQLKGKEFTSDTIVDLLCENYDVDIDQAKSDAEILLQDFQKQGLLEK